MALLGYTQILIRRTDLNLNVVCPRANGLVETEGSLHACFNGTTLRVVVCKPDLIRTDGREITALLQRIALCVAIRLTASMLGVYYVNDV
jgi:hypothetical protein